MFLEMADHDIACCRICQTTDQVEKLKELEKVLPPGYPHILCEVGEEERVRLKVRLSTVEDAERWFSGFQNRSTITWRKARTYPASGKYNAYKVDYRCQHKTYCSGPKDTDCPATITLVLKRSTEDRRSRSTDRHMGEGYLLHVKWNNNHNHLLGCAMALSKRDVSRETVERLTELFQLGHSPSSALDTIKYDLREEKGEDYFLVAADRSVVPDLGFCYRLYYKISAKAYGATSSSVAGTGTSDTEGLKRRLDDFVGDLKRKLEEDESYRAPVKAFLDKFSKLHTDTAVQSALFSLGKAPRARPKGRVRPRGFLQGASSKQAPQ